MTVIIGLVTKDGVYMGGDSCSDNGWVQQCLASPKIFKLPKSNILVGTSGDHRYQQIMRYHADLELPEGDAEEVLIKTFIPALRETLKTHGGEQTENGQTTSGSNAALIAFRERLFEVDSLFAVTEYKQGFGTIGSGGIIALGALAALIPYTDLRFNPQPMLEKVLAIAEQYGSGVRAPFTIEVLR